MKFTLDWLKDYTDIEGLTAEQIADNLTMLGLEVDSVTPLYEELAVITSYSIHYTKLYDTSLLPPLPQVQFLRKRARRLQLQAESLPKNLLHLIIRRLPSNCRPPALLNQPLLNCRQDQSKSLQHQQI